MPLVFPVDFQYQPDAVQKARKFYKIVFEFDFFVSSVQVVAIVFPPCLF